MPNDGPMVWDGKRQQYVPATQAICSDCGMKRFIAMRGPLGKVCFECEQKRWDRWNRKADAGKDG
jgi:hypothetical protein